MVRGQDAGSRILPIRHALWQGACSGYGSNTMTLTIEKPETEARLIRFATLRGISPLEALDELLDEVK